jgi:hypothetical protein
MSRYFVTDPPVPVMEFDPAEVISDTPPNIIFIKSKMDVATDARVKSELVKMAGDNKTVEMHLGENQLALLIHNIVRWEGPDLGSIPCTPANIRTLDPTEPHIALVLEEIARRNARKESPLPKSPTEPGSATNGSIDGSPQNAAEISHPSGISILRSPLLRALDGRPSRSDD